jgi:hypothetical protein
VAAKALGAKLDAPTTHAAADYADGSVNKTCEWDGKDAARSFLGRLAIILQDRRGRNKVCLAWFSRALRGPACDCIFLKPSVGSAFPAPLGTGLQIADVHSPIALSDGFWIPVLISSPEPRKLAESAALHGDASSCCIPAHAHPSLATLFGHLWARASSARALLGSLGCIKVWPVPKVASVAC